MLQNLAAPISTQFSSTTMASLKGPGQPEKFDSSALRIGIVHARWNTSIVESLVKNARTELLSLGVNEPNIIIQSVPGSWELPLACSKFFSASQIQSTTTSSLGSSGDLLGSSTTDLSAIPTASSPERSGPFDALIAIGVLIKGETMHFEYICEAVSQGLMRVQMEKNVPIVFGLLTVLEETQATARIEHARQWAEAAVEMGCKKRGWEKGVMS